MTGQLTDVTGWDERLAAVVEDCRSKILDHGFTVIGVGADPENSVPQFAYTVGVSVQRGFEFVISGLPIETMHEALSRLARRALCDTVGFTPTNGMQVPGVFAPPFQPRLMRVHDEWPLGMIRRALGNATCPQRWQAQFPDVGGRYPGEDGYCLSPGKQTDFTQPKQPATSAALDESSDCDV